MTCTHHLNDGPLVCVVEGEHTTHVYHSTTVADGRHDDEGGDW